MLGKVKYWLYNHRVKRSLKKSKRKEREKFELTRMTCRRIGQVLFFSGFIWIDAVILSIHLIAGLLGAGLILVFVGSIFLSAASG